MIKGNSLNIGKNTVNNTSETFSLIKELLILETKINGEVLQYMNPCMFLIKCVSFYIYSVEDYLTALPQIDHLFSKGEQILSVNSAIFNLITTHLYRLKLNYDTRSPHKVEDQLSVSEIYILLLLIYEICHEYFKDKNTMVKQEFNAYKICQDLINKLETEIEQIDSKNYFHIDFSQGVIGKLTKEINKGGDKTKP